jgi:peptidoglycan/xylan/chitin deacetylase (PgdA/CDA1 family)
VAVWWSSHWTTGYADNVENALPILLGLRFRATCYVTSGALGRYNV